MKKTPIIIDEIDFTPYIESFVECSDRLHLIYQGTATDEEGTLVEAMVLGLPKGIPIRIRDTEHLPFGFSTGTVFIDTIHNHWDAITFLFTIKLAKVS